LTPAEWPGIDCGLTAGGAAGSGAFDEADLTAGATRPGPPVRSDPGRDGDIIPPKTRPDKGGRVARSPVRRAARAYSGRRLRGVARAVPRLGEFRPDREGGYAVR